MVFFENQNDYRVFKKYQTLNSPLDFSRLPLKNGEKTLKEFIDEREESSLDNEEKMPKSESVKCLNSEIKDENQKNYFLISSYVVEKNNSEKLVHYSDRFPFLSLRKVLLNQK